MKQLHAIHDHDLFNQEMYDVTPLKQAKASRLPKSKPLTPGQLYRREAAEFHQQEKHSALSLVLNNQLSAGDWLSFKQNGVQNGVFKNLRTGKYALEATLNLQGKSPQQARHELLEFIAECQDNHLRSTLISFSRNAAGILLKSYLAQWLPKLNNVQAFHTAQQHHGGDRAIYVLLRKSEAKKAETRERIAARLAQ